MMSVNVYLLLILYRETLSSATVGQDMVKDEKSNAQALKEDADSGKDESKDEKKVKDGCKEGCKEGWGYCDR